MPLHLCDDGWVLLARVGELEEDLPIVQPGELEQARREFGEHTRQCPTCRERVGERADWETSIPRQFAQGE